VNNLDTTKAINYCFSCWDAFTRFLDDGRLRMSNNGADRELRAVALGRKIRTSAGSDEGGRREAAICSSIATANLTDIDPQAWPADVLARLADQPTKSIHELPPWNWRPQNVAHAALAISHPPKTSQPGAYAGCVRSGVARAYLSAFVHRVLNLGAGSSPSKSDDIGVCFA